MTNQDRLTGVLPTFMQFHEIWVMRFFVLYYQIIEFTGAYQRWTTYALIPKSVTEMHFRENSKRPQSLGKNGCRQNCLHKSLTF